MPPELDQVDPEKVYELVDADGNVAYRKGAHLDKAFALGMRLRSAGDDVAALQQEGEERFFTTPEQQAGAVVRGALSGATLGGSDLIDRGVDSPGQLELKRLAREHNAGKVAVAELAGAAIPALVSGGAGAIGTAARATPAGLSAAIGTGLAAAAPGAGFAARAGRAAAGFAVEGAIQGAGQGIAELAQAEDPLTIERAASVIGSNALFGGTIGAVIGAGGVATVEGGRTVAKGLKRSRELVGDLGGKLRGQAAGEDLAALDRKGLRAARDAHLDELQAGELAQRTAAREAAAGALAPHRAAVDDSGAWLVVEGESAKNLVKAKRALRSALDDPKGLARNPQQALKALRVEESALERAIADAPGTLEKLAAEDAKLAQLERATMPDNAAEIVFQGKTAKRYGQFDQTVRVSAKDPQISVPREQAARFLDALERGEVHGMRVKALEEGVPRALQSNRAAQAQIEAAAAAPTPRFELKSDRLAAIAEAEDALAERGKKGLIEQMVQGSVYGAAVGAMPAMPFGSVLAPLLGAKVSGAVTGLVFGRGARAVADASERTARAVAAFVETGKKVGPAAPPLATKVLGSVAFAPPPKRAAELPGKAAPGLLETYKKREAELYSQVTTDATGRVVMSPAARRQVAERLAPVHVLSPRLADQLETMAARRLEFLASKLPKRPDFAAMQMGPDRWRPSDMDMRKFARYVAAVEDPGAVEERLAQGTVTPEDAEAYRTVYPERFNDLRRQVLAKVGELRATLPFERRIALSIFTGVPVDPAMQPSTIRRLQAQFAIEPGSVGGTQSPAAAPQGGSIARESSEKPTPAQERASA
jgi:hypothetical protein